MNLTKYQLAPIRSSDGRDWCQNCYVCNKQINFLQDPSGYRWIRMDRVVRHRKCYPQAVK